MSGTAAPAAAPTPAVQVTDLKVYFRPRRGIRKPKVVRAVDGLSFTLAPGETLGIAGESGSGKSTVARTIVQINKPTSGDITVGGKSAVGLRGQELRAYRRRMQMVYQDPYDSLDPRMSVLKSITEGLEVRGVARARHRAEASELLERVNLPVSLLSRFPGQLSGGQRQRVSIARALAVKPDVIVCDEAVAALDVSIRAQVLNLLKDIQQSSAISYVFISHDLSTLRFLADRVAIMYLGRVVEYGTSAEVFGDPQHPYTRALIAAVPEVEIPTGPRPVLAGEPPDPTAPPSGCPFHPRCPIAEDRCRETLPPLVRKRSGAEAACLLAADATDSSDSANEVN